MARPKSGETNDKKQQFGMWLGLPVAARPGDSKTQYQICEKIGITKKTASKWRQDPLVQDTARNIIKLLAGNDQVEVLNAIIKDAKGGQAAQQRIFAEMMGWIGTRKPDGGGTPDFRVIFTTDNK